MYFPLSKTDYSNCETTMLLLQILIWTANPSHQNVSDFSYTILSPYLYAATFYKAKDCLRNF